jgi:hypothetical protein
VIPSFYDKEEKGSRVVDLADGRVLFLPRGRGGPAYVVRDDSQGYVLERRLEWAERIAAYAAIAVLAAAGVLERWILLGLIVPLLAIPRMVESVLTAKLRPATDSKALSEVEAPDPGAVGWGGLLLLAISAGWWYYLWQFSDPDSKRRSFDLLMGSFWLAATAVQLFRQHRTAQERRITTISGDPDNTPIVPR